MIPWGKLAPDLDGQGSVFALTAVTTALGARRPKTGDKTVCIHSSLRLINPPPTQLMVLLRCEHNCAVLLGGMVGNRQSLLAQGALSFTA